MEQCKYYTIYGTYIVCVTTFFMTYTECKINILPFVSRVHYCILLYLVDSELTWSHLHDMELPGCRSSTRCLVVMHFCGAPQYISYSSLFQTGVPRFSEVKRDRCIVRNAHFILSGPQYVHKRTDNIVLFCSLCI